MPRSISSIRIYNDEYKQWRLAVLNKCDSKCVRCGSYKEPHCHHIKPWAKFPELRFDVDNGEVLCKLCHHKEHPFMAVLERKAKARKEYKRIKELKRRKMKALKKKQAKLFKKKKKKVAWNQATNPNWSCNAKVAAFETEMKQRVELSNT